ncbi:acidic mammalian chitinase-like [Brachionus plicatilis]|uniref:Acidic mammalian chitinase-like n=1 Tax=Brachionus plicatilis TaxID=10195 RepID=A0A3M7RQN7_BRAPC|nr:acidic mammalian chitinase-like [Brachionus plicatilis]
MMIKSKRRNFTKISTFLVMIVFPIVLSKRNSKLCRDHLNCQAYSSCIDDQQSVGECSNNSVFSDDFQKCVPAISIEDFQCIILAKYLSDHSSISNKKFSSLVQSRKDKIKETESSEFMIEDNADDGNTYKRMCVVTNWSQFRPGRGRFSFDFIDSTLCNYVVETDYDYYDSEEFEIQAVQHNEMDLYYKLRALKKQNPSLKLILRVTDENGRVYSKLSKSFDTRLNFCQNLLEYVQDNGFDGAEIEWRWPAGPSGIPADKENFILLLKNV